jgi:hypothetical protein
MMPAIAALIGPHIASRLGCKFHDDIGSDLNGMRPAFAIHPQHIGTGGVTYGLEFGRTMPLKPLREGSVDRRNELGVVNRFFNEIFRSGLYGRHSHRHVRVTGNENDRERDILTSELANEAEAVHPGHSHIRDNPSNVPVIKHLKKSVGRLEGLDAVANTLSFLELDLNPAFAGGDFHIPIMVGISHDGVAASQNVTSAREQRGCAIAG